MRGKRFESAAAVAVLDNDRLAGVVTIERMFGAPEGASVRDVMDHPPPVVAPDTDQEHAAWQAVHRDEPGLAVIDDQGRFRGLIPPHKLLAVLWPTRWAPRPRRSHPSGLSVGVGIRRIGGREALTGLSVGVLLSAVMLPVVALMTGDWNLGLAVALAVLAASTIATVVAFGAALAAAPPGQGSRLRLRAAGHRDPRPALDPDLPRRGHRPARPTAPEQWMTWLSYPSQPQRFSAKSQRCDRMLRSRHR